MKSIVRAFVLAMLLVASRAGAEDQIRWAADFKTACQLAADQHRLVLLHFYNDNCEPCVRVERNVFSQTQVGEAVAVNYVAVKVHAGKEPQLANRYRVRSWPTDVFVTPSGLEVYRSISPPKPDDYISLVNQVAQQTGVSSSRNWTSKLSPTVAPAAAAADAASAAASGVRQATEQAAVTAQDNFTQGQERWNAALDQFKAASDQARTTAVQTAQQADHRWRQTQDQAGAVGAQWSQQATEAVDRYEQQAGDAYRNFREQTNQAAQGVQQQAQQVKQDAEGVAQQTADTLRGAASRWQQTFSQSAASAASAAGITSTTPVVAANAAAPPADKPASPAPPLLPTDNPWMATKPQDAAASAPSHDSTAAPAVADSAPPLLPPSSSAAHTPQAAPPPTAPPATSRAPEIASPLAAAAGAAVAAGNTAAEAPPAQPQYSTATPPAAAQPPASAYGPGQLVPVSQAPPLAMDGFCPVSLLETVARDPHDRAAWKKGNPKFGAIHLGRTYLFTSAENQQKFLANPDAYAPVLSGCDPVVFAERGKLLDGKRAYGLITPDKRIYLFADEAALRKFNQSPGSYAAAAQQARLHGDAGHVYR